MESKPLEIVEKVPLQKLNLVKWDKNHTIRHLFCVRSNIWAVLKPKVGVFRAEFANKWFFDSLVGPLSFRHFVHQKCDIQNLWKGIQR